jgi:hypothetical protein
MARRSVILFAVACVLLACVVGVLAQVTNPTTGTSIFGTNGTRADALRTASVANSYTSEGTTAPSIGALLSEKSARWSIYNLATVSSQATVSQAAVSGVKHVADCITFAASAGTAIASATSADIVLRDGPSVTGTPVWSVNFGVPATTGNFAGPLAFCGLNIVGSTNTAMTIEFAAGVTNMWQSVGLTGYDIH